MGENVLFNGVEDVFCVDYEGFKDTYRLQQKNMTNEIILFRFVFDLI